MKKSLKIIPAFALAAVMLALSGFGIGCTLTDRWNMASNVRDAANVLEINLTPSQLVFEDDSRDFQGWGHYYAEFDLLTPAPGFPENGHWRELPMTEEMRSFMIGEGERFGHPFTEPAHGYWFLKTYTDKSGNSAWFGFDSEFAKTYYHAAFYDEDTGKLTIYYRAVF